MSNTNESATVFVDADNTLWDTDSVFASAQVNLLDAIEEETGRKCTENDRLAFVRVVDQGIAERHHLGLRYPPRLLVNALADALHGQDSERAVRLALTGSSAIHISNERSALIVEAYGADLGRLPALRPGVGVGLLALQDAACNVLIVTEGPRTKVEWTAESLGLCGHFTRIVEGVKRPDLYRRVLRVTKTSSRAYMVGDQLDRDIGPAKAAGLVTIYFPGGFRPRWSLETGSVQPDYVVASFADVPRIVLSYRLSKPQCRAYHSAKFRGFGFV